jgi:hypothetical protein
MSPYTAEDGRELAERLAMARSEGGTPHEEVASRWRQQLADRLRTLVSSYTGEPGQEAEARELLETWAVDAGVPLRRP